MDIKFYYENTSLTIQQIADKLGLKLTSTWKFIKNNYSSEYRKARKVHNYRQSKLGNKNPQSHRIYPVVDVSDGKGYLMRIKPDWYTGRKGSKHVFVHQLVVCEELGITEIPKGWVVHHCDENPQNNDFNNLVLLTMRDHMRLHSALKGATTISKESTLKWVEAHGTPWRDDIVCSAQECAAPRQQPNDLL